jgi:DNA modification methylase
MSMHQLPLPISVHDTDGTEPLDGCHDRLVALLGQDLDFHGRDSGYASHSLHSFPARFPPQLPRKFIGSLTNPGDVVLDPMMGSGTTIVEAFLADRCGIGLDIDPLAVKASRVKVSPLSVDQAMQVGNRILELAANAIAGNRGELEQKLETLWDPKTREFIDYWFMPETQIELAALMCEIERIGDSGLRAFLELAFSAIIITKSGGVSLAVDLAHTRPQRAKAVVGHTGTTVLERNLRNTSSRRVRILTKTLRPALQEFRNRFERNVTSFASVALAGTPPGIMFGDAQCLPLADASVDLVVTSPPYPSNAIDYMRAHKFSLVWMGYPIEELGRERRRYIGGEAVTNVGFERLPETTAEIVSEIADRDESKARVLERYYSEMTRVLRELHRVLKPGKAAVVVVGSSTMRGRDTRTHMCLAEIGREVGFQLAKIGVRELDRNRRMLPAGSSVDLASQIQQRMHEEYVIGFYKLHAPAS